MVETLTPAVCGSRTRQRVAVALFGLAAVATAAALGALLALLGGALGADRVVLAAAALAVLAAGREAGLVRLPIPQSRRQVPEAWRFQLPLPVWATGYGAGLGAGFLTYQPVATFWVACAGALALARPLPAALCFALYGAGRAVTLVWPRRRGAEATVAVERIVARRPALVRANVAGLTACAALLALAPAAEGGRVMYGMDPSVHRGVLALGKQNGTVVIRGRGIAYRGAAPSLDRWRMAYVAADGIRIVSWRSGRLLARIRDDQASLPSLDWPLLAYRRDSPRASRLVLKNFASGRRRVLDRVKRRNDLGRPSLRRGHIAWHVASRGGSRVKIMNLRTGRRRTVAKSKVALLRNPALSPARRIIWTEERSGRAYLRLRGISGGRVRTVQRFRTRRAAFWTTALFDRAWVTRWSLRTGRASLYRYGLNRG